MRRPSLNRVVFFPFDLWARPGFFPNFFSLYLWLCSGGRQWRCWLPQRCKASRAFSSNRCACQLIVSPHAHSSRSKILPVTLQSTSLLLVFPRGMSTDGSLAPPSRVIHRDVVCAHFSSCMSAAPFCTVPAYTLDSADFMWHNGNEAKLDCQEASTIRRYMKQAPSGDIYRWLFIVWYSRN